MIFEDKITTRGFLDWVIAGISISLGTPIALIFGIGMIYYGFDIRPFFALVIGIVFLWVGVTVIYRIIYPKEYTRIVSDEMIICKSNGNTAYEFKKGDIKKIIIYEGEIDSVDIEMKNNERVNFPGAYFMDLSRFRGELEMCLYPVN